MLNFVCFNRCLWHGCSCLGLTIHPRTKQPMFQLYNNTIKQEKELRRLGYRVISIWGHQFTELKQYNDNAREYVKTLDVQSRLNPRDSFFGGRTNCVKLHYEADLNASEEIR